MKRLSLPQASAPQASAGQMSAGKAAARRRPAEVPAARLPELPDDRTRIWQAVNAIPKGRVSTYGGIARLAALPRRARLVGRVLSELPASTRLPWQRVVSASGHIVQRGDAATLQAKRLAAEGVRLNGTRVDLRAYGWPDAEDRNAD